jgi:hypothetical protein
MTRCPFYPVARHLVQTLGVPPPAHNATHIHVSSSETALMLICIWYVAVTCLAGSCLRAKLAPQVACVWQKRALGLACYAPSAHPAQKARPDIGTHLGVGAPRFGTLDTVLTAKRLPVATLMPSRTTPKLPAPITRPR